MHELNATYSFIEVSIQKDLLSSIIYHTGRLPQIISSTYWFHVTAQITFMRMTITCMWFGHRC